MTESKTTANTDASVDEVASVKPAANNLTDDGVLDPRYRLIAEQAMRIDQLERELAELRNRLASLG